jgi:hypothetical protein
MTISELIQTLQEVQAQHGDIEVVVAEELGRRPRPRVQEAFWQWEPEDVELPMELWL